MKKITCLTWAALLVLCSCSMDDEDRCPEGFYYHSKTRTCLEDTGESKDNKSASDGEYDSSIDGNRVDQDATAEDTRPSGLGKSCTTMEDCTPYEEDYCSYNDMAGAGYCTIANCSFGECPAGYQCCDCSNATISLGGEIDIMCINDEQASLAESVASCTCE